MVANLSERSIQLVFGLDRLKDLKEFLQVSIGWQRQVGYHIGFSNENTFQKALNTPFEYFLKLNQDFICLCVDD